MLILEDMLQSYPFLAVTEYQSLLTEIKAQKRLSEG